MHPDPAVRGVVFFFNDTATTEIYTLSLHDALPIYTLPPGEIRWGRNTPPANTRSEEHTSELQSPCNLVCRLLLENKRSKQPSAGEALSKEARGVENRR